MSRTVESIVSCHQAATALRRAGKPIWAATVRLKDILAQYKDAADDLTAEQAVEMSRKIALALKLGVPAAWRGTESDNYNMDFEDLFERFEQASTADFTPSKGWPASPCEVIDDWLDELYDWGDRYRVWLG